MQIRRRRFLQATILSNNWCLSHQDHHYFGNRAQTLRSCTYSKWNQHPHGQKTSFIAMYSFLFCSNKIIATPIKASAQICWFTIFRFCFQILTHTVHLTWRVSQICLPCRKHSFPQIISCSLPVCLYSTSFCLCQTLEWENYFLHSVTELSKCGRWKGWSAPQKVFLYADVPLKSVPLSQREGL